MNRTILSLCVSALLGLVMIVQSENWKANKISEYPTPTIREEQQLTVNGALETWRLQWSAAPKSYCGASESDIALTCPCWGFAYGEAGDLHLLRLRNGMEIDRLHLTPLFEEQEAAVVQRWPEEKRDFKLS